MHSGLQMIDLGGTCIVTVKCFVKTLGFLILFSDNAISAPAAALLVHYIVSHEQLKEFSIDGEYLITFEISIVDAVIQFRLRKFRNAPSGRS